MFFSQIFANCERNSREESQDDLDLMTLVVINAKYQGKWSLRLLYLHSLGIEMDHSYTKRRIITKLGMGSVVIGVQLWIEMNSYQKNYVLLGKNWKFFQFFGKVFRKISPPCNYWISSRVLDRPKNSQMRVKFSGNRSFTNSNSNSWITMIFFQKKLNISAGTTDRKNCVNLVVKMKSSRLASGKLL